MSNLASIVTILSLGIAPAWYFWKKNQDEKDKKSRASRNLYIELNNALDGLDETKYSDLKKVKIGNSEFFFMNRALNHDFYDSLIYSGYINFLPPKIQQEVQDNFQRIKDHNFYLRKIRNNQDDFPHDEATKNYKYYEKLQNDEEMLLDEIPKIQEKLKKEFEIDNSIFS